MAGLSLLALLDDLATLLDDIGTLTKDAGSQTVGVLGDDLALNAEQVSGLRPERELPVVWAVAKGSALNKLILVPVAMTLSFFLPWIITPMLMLGGGYLCFEGFEKVLEAFFHGSKAEDPAVARAARLEAASKSNIDLVAFEKKKIKGAIRTDLVLSAEIVVITLGTVADAPFMQQAIVVSIVAAVLTVGVYAIVAGIVKMDDVGASMVRNNAKESLAAKSGRGLLWFAPRFLKGLTIVGTAAMFLVGGGILVHGLPPLHPLVHGAEHAALSLPHLGLILGPTVVTGLNALIGVVFGAVAVAVLHLLAKLRSPQRGTEE